MLVALSPIVFRLKETREAAGLTQSQLAEAVGVRQATISDLETGKSRRIELDVLDSLCAALGKALGRPITPGELLEREPEPRKGRRT